jgi:ribose transport system permease protein
MMILGGVSTITYNSIGSRNVAFKTIDHHIFKETWLMVLVLIVEVLIVTYLFNYTKFGKYAKAIGANPVAAQQSGINIVKYKIIAYVIMGICVVVASLFQMGYTGSASDSTGTGFEMNVMVALILGGDTAALICEITYKQVIPVIVKVSTVMILLGLACMYMSGEKSLTPSEKKKKITNKK